jgi:hypothetical protein
VHREARLHGQRLAPAGCAAAPQVELPDPASALEALFVFALTWSFGGSLDAASRTEFSGFVAKCVPGPAPCSVLSCQRAWPVRVLVMQIGCWLVLTDRCK